MTQITPATTKLLKLRKRLRVVCGGTSASKTFSILMILIDYAQSNRNKKIDVMSESYPHLEDGAIKDFKQIMIEREYWIDDRWNSTKHVYSFETGSVIKFISVDKIGKSRGPRRDVLFVNEANNIDYNIVDQLEVRTSKTVWIDFNPTHEFWYYTEWKDKRDHDFLRLTYQDCLDALPKSIIESIESHKGNKNWWKVYGLGELGVLEGRIYTDWAIIDEIPHEARLERRGLDFGYSNDPTAIVDIYKFNDGYILDEVLYRKGMHNKDIADILKNLPDCLTVADSAEPKSIAEIKDYGINIIGAKKQGARKLGSMVIGSDGSYVKWSIGVVQEQRLSMTKRSLNIIKAYRNYLWKTDKEGKILNEPEHYLSDCMDAIRYGIVSLAPIINRQDFLRNIPIMIPKEEPNPAR